MNALLEITEVHATLQCYVSINAERSDYTYATLLYKCMVQMDGMLSGHHL